MLWRQDWGSWGSSFQHCSRVLRYPWENTQEATSMYKKHCLLICTNENDSKIPFPRFECRLKIRMPSTTPAMLDTIISGGPNRSGSATVEISPKKEHPLDDIPFK